MGFVLYSICAASLPRLLHRGAFTTYSSTPTFSINKHPIACWLLMIEIIFVRLATHLRFNVGATWLPNSNMTSSKVKINHCIICFKIKNPPTLHSSSKIQPTTSPTFVFSVSASVRKKWGYEKKTVDSRFDDSSSCFLFWFYYFTQKVWSGSYDLFVHNYFVLRK
jgi:hypothetical protein